MIPFGILIGFLIAAVFFGMVELVHRSVYGPMLSDEVVGPYIEKYLDKMTLNEYQRDGTLFSDLPRYISRSQSFLTKWHINGYGTIPRWSKWSDVLEKKRRELMAKGLVTLADL